MRSRDQRRVLRLRGAGARDNHKSEGKSSLRSGLPLSLKVFSRARFASETAQFAKGKRALSFLISLPLWCAPPSLLVLRGSVVLNAFAVRIRLLMLPKEECVRFADLHFSRFILYRSPFTLSIGSSHATEAASSGVYYECWASHAAGSRREMPAGAPRKPRLAVCTANVGEHFLVRPSPWAKPTRRDIISNQDTSVNKQISEIRNRAPYDARF